MANDLYLLGIEDVSDLKNRDPQLLYEDLVRRHGGRADRCRLYVFRWAVYYASNEVHDPELLKWWNWKDGK